MRRICRKLQKSRCVCHAVAKILQRCLLMTSMNCLWSVAWTNVWCLFLSGVVKFMWDHFGITMDKFIWNQFGLSSMKLYSGNGVLHFCISGIVMKPYKARRADCHNSHKQNQYTVQLINGLQSVSQSRHAILTGHFILDWKFGNVNFVQGARGTTFDIVEIPQVSSEDSESDEDLNNVCWVAHWDCIVQVHLFLLLRLVWLLDTYSSLSFHSLLTSATSRSLNMVPGHWTFCSYRASPYPIMMANWWAVMRQGLKMRQLVSGWSHVCLLKKQDWCVVLTWPCGNHVMRYLFPFGDELPWLLPTLPQEFWSSNACGKPS